VKTLIPLIEEKKVCVFLRASRSASNRGENSSCTLDNLIQPELGKSPLGYSIGTESPLRFDRKTVENIRAVRKTCAEPVEVSVYKKPFQSLSRTDADFTTTRHRQKLLSNDSGCQLRGCQAR
jgi:hypothetical protein